MLLPYNEPVHEIPLGRELEFKTISEAMTESIKHDIGMNIYVYGQPGFGKTSLIRNAIAHMQKSFVHKANAFEVVYIQGNAVDREYLYSTIAHQLGIVTEDEVYLHRVLKSARSMVLQRFKSPCYTSYRKRRIPLTLLFVDEMDLAPLDEIRVLMNIAGSPNTSLLIIGAGNHSTTFMQRVKTMNPPMFVVFKEYTKDQLIQIFKSRNTHGLFNPHSLELIARKLLQNNPCGGDVRKGIAIMQKTLENRIRQGLDKDPSEWEGTINTWPIIYVLHN